MISERAEGREGQRLTDCFGTQESLNPEKQLLKPKNTGYKLGFFKASDMYPVFFNAIFLKVSDLAFLQRSVSRCSPRPFCAVCEVIIS